MTRHTRRQLLATVAAGSAVAVAGCSGGDGNDSSGNSSNNGNDDSEEQSTGITSLDTVIDKTEGGVAPEIDVYLNVELAEWVDADQVTLERADVAGVTEKRVNTRSEPPHATMLIRSKFDSDTIPQAPYKVVARSSDGEQIASRSWTPDTTVEYSSFSVQTEELDVSPGFYLNFDITNRGDLDLSTPDAYITEGYPTTVHQSDSVETMTTSDSVRPTESKTVTSQLIDRGTLLMPVDGKCPAAPKDIGVTLEYPNRSSHKLDLTLRLGGEPVEVDGNIIGCAETTVDEWSKSEL
jgi:hypothetical protein